MALRNRRHGSSNGLDAWPGYVDALSTLLMVIIFVLLVFVLSQAFLTVALNGRSKALDKATAELAELASALSLERGQVATLQLSVSQIGRQLQDRTADRDRLAAQLADASTAGQAAAAALARLQAQAAATAADLALRTSERDKLTTQLAAANQTTQAAKSENEYLQNQITGLRGQVDAATAGLAARSIERDRLAAQLSTAAQYARAAKDDNDRLQAQLTETRAQLAAAANELTASRQRLDETKAQIAALDRTVTIGKDTLEARISDLARLAEQTRALTALRDELEKQAQDAAARATTEAQRRAAVETQLADERKLGDSARAQIALMNQQIDELKKQMTAVAAALELSEKQGKEKEAEIANLGSKLIVSLADKVEELQRYRSEFFGRLRALTANRPGIQVVGDRFVFQSEVLFPLGSAELTKAGIAQLTALAITIKDLAAEIPADTPWMLRVDGHTDPQPLKNLPFASNWELSAARAITVVKLLISYGVPAEHLAATGFGQYQPFAPGDTPEAYAKDRRIELRLTDR
jgi:chemotaxis protein MotB